MSECSKCKCVFLMPRKSQDHREEIPTASRHKKCCVLHMLSSVLKTDSVWELSVSSLVNPLDRPTHAHKKI